MSLSHAQRLLLLFVGSVFLVVHVACAGVDNDKNNNNDAKLRRHARTQVVYGVDGRRDAYDVAAAAADIAASAVAADSNTSVNVVDAAATLAPLMASTAVVVSSLDLEFDATRQTYNALRRSEPLFFTLAANWPVCPRERFYAQPRLGGCTAFLIGADRVVTAGHCVQPDTCRSSLFVFDYALDRNIDSGDGRPGGGAGYDYDGPDATHRDAVDAALRHPLDALPARVVFGCAEMLGHAHDPRGGLDYAVIRLSRAVDVAARPPMSLDFGAVPAVGVPLYVVGHPNGLPLKVTTTARVTKRSSTLAHLFYVDADTYAGNSGSPVVRADTGAVVGLVMTGQDDWACDINTATGAACVRSAVCGGGDSSGGGCPGYESVVSVRVLQHLQPDYYGVDVTADGVLGSYLLNIADAVTPTVTLRNWSRDQTVRDIRVYVVSQTVSALSTMSSTTTTTRLQRVDNSDNTSAATSTAAATGSEHAGSIITLAPLESASFRVNVDWDEVNRLLDAAAADAAATTAPGGATTTTAGLGPGDFPQHDDRDVDSGVGVGGGVIGAISNVFYSVFVEYDDRVATSSVSQSSVSSSPATTSSPSSSSSSSATFSVDDNNLLPRGATVIAKQTVALSPSDHTHTSSTLAVRRFRQRLDLRIPRITPLCPGVTTVTVAVRTGISPLGVAPWCAPAAGPLALYSFTAAADGLVSIVSECPPPTSNAAASNVNTSTIDGGIVDSILQITAVGSRHTWFDQQQCSDDKCGVSASITDFVVHAGESYLLSATTYPRDDDVDYVNGDHVFRIQFTTTSSTSGTVIVDCPAVVSSSSSPPFQFAMDAYAPDSFNGRTGLWCVNADATPTSSPTTPTTTTTPMAPNAAVTPTTNGGNVDITATDLSSAVRGRNVPLTAVSLLLSVVSGLVAVCCALRL